MSAGVWCEVSKKNKIKYNNDNDKPRSTSINKVSTNQRKVNINDPKDFPSLEPTNSKFVSTTKCMSNLKLSHSKIVSQKPRQVLKISDKKSEKSTINIIPSSKLKELLPKTWNLNQTLTNNNNKNSYYKNVLKPNSDEYLKVTRFFNKTCGHITINKIEKIENPFTYLMYQLKKIELEKIYKKLSEIILFHGTTIDNLESILNNNLNWRLSGKNVGVKYGRGVAFSHSAKYSLSYSDDIDAPRNIIIMAKVLYSKSCDGLNGIDLPKLGCDTTKGNNGMVWVKYNDWEFYPGYVITVNSIL